MILAVLLLASGILTMKLVGDTDGVHADTTGDQNGASAPANPSPEAYQSPSPTPVTPESRNPAPEVVEEGKGTWAYAKAPEPADTFGDSGTVLSYNVAVEDGTHQDPDEFADIVTDTLSDDRSWTAGGQWRFTPVREGYADFTVFLASPRTRTQLCGAEDTYTSCRNGDSVVVNLERWLLSVPHWPEGIGTYRQYVVNHEVGHRLGEEHMVCPKKGSVSPVMAQQTFELRGCKANAWPYVDGDYITGPAGEYQ
ncbi:MAG: DUF3152 domain-containing protein [Stackebrandtia sp.]